jgi:mannose-6-phosphate isomerase-like protein (cupin superfamily)
MNGAPITTGRVDGTDLTHRWGSENGAPGGRIDFPVATARLRPGERLGRHTHDAEEVLIVVEGTAEARVGPHRRRLRAGSMILIPELVSHDIHNVGSATLSVLGAFSSDAPSASFE